MSSLLSAIWKTKDGREIQVSDLSYSHLMDIINMLRRNRFATDKEFCCLLAYIATAPDGAAQAAEQALAEVRLLPGDMLQALEDELARRDSTTSSPAKHTRSHAEERREED